MDDLLNINDLMTFLDIEDSDGLGAKPNLPVLRPIKSKQKPSIASAAPAIQSDSIEDKMAMMKLAVESSTSIDERIDYIKSSLQHDKQQVNHYRLPRELALSKF